MRIFGQAWLGRLGRAHSGVTLSLVEVRSRAELASFIALPRRLYAGMAGYVPPLDLDRREMLDRKHAAFFSHGEACYWLAMRDGQAVGRISAQIDRLATGPEVAAAGFFGCLDAIDDPAVMRLLVGAAEDWIRARGKTAAQGPYLLSINGEAGLLVEGQGEPPMVMMPWHPRYLAGLLAALGYACVQTLLAFRLELAALDAAGWQRIAGRRRARFTLRGLQMKALPAEGRRAQVMFNDAWSGNWGFVPLAAEDVAALTTGFRPFLRSDSAVVAEEDGEPVGFMLVLPNVFEIIGDLGGRPGLLGWPRFVWRLLRARYRDVRIILMGITGRYRGTPLSAEIAAAMITEMIARARRRGLAGVEAGWILADNAPVIAMLRLFGFRECRRYAIYHRELSTPPGAQV